MTQTPEDLKKKAREETRQLCEEAYGQILDKEVIDATVEYWSKRTDTLIEQVYHAGFQLGWKDGHQEGIDARTEEVVKEAISFVEKYEAMPFTPTTFARIKQSIATLTPKVSNDN